MNSRTNKLRLASYSGVYSLTISPDNQMLVSGVMGFYQFVT